MAEGHLSIDVLYTNPKTIWSVMWCTATLCCLVTLVVVQSHKRRHARLNAELMPRYGKRCVSVRARVRVRASVAMIPVGVGLCLMPHAPCPITYDPSPSHQPSFAQLQLHGCVLTILDCISCVSLSSLIIVLIPDLGE